MIRCSVDASLADARGPRRRRRAVVVFVDVPATRWHRILSPGFRHCFVAIDDGGWVLIDPLKHRLEIRRLELPETFDLAAFFARRGHATLTGSFVPDEQIPILTLECVSCVTVVKRVLGLACLGVQTPRQLHRHLLERATPAFVAVDQVNFSLDSKVK